MSRSQLCKAVIAAALLAVPCRLEAQAPGSTLAQDSAAVREAGVWTHEGTYDYLTAKKRAEELTSKEQVAKLVYVESTGKYEVWFKPR